jgi:hypothetical protein
MTRPPFVKPKKPEDLLMTSTDSSANDGSQYVIRLIAIGSGMDCKILSETVADGTGTSVLLHTPECCFLADTNLHHKFINVLISCRFNHCYQNTVLGPRHRSGNLAARKTHNPVSVTNLPAGLHGYDPDTLSPAVWFFIIIIF